MTARRSTSARLKAPFLRSIRLDEAKKPFPDEYPFSIPAVDGHFRIDFNRPVTIIVGPNGSGKSTILEAIATLCGFGRFGGGRNYFNKDANKDELLSRYLIPAWKPKVSRGFFSRSETFHSFIQQIDKIATDSGRDIYQGYGGKSLSERSHGEAYLSLFENRIGSEGIYILDEPEAALSPSRQLEFLRMLRRAEEKEFTQFIIATHSPLLMAYPESSLLHLTEKGILERPFQLTEHFKILQEFYSDPDAFMRQLLKESE